MKVKSESEVTQSCPTLSDPMDCSLPGSSIHGIFQARVLEWVAMIVELKPWHFLHLAVWLIHIPYLDLLAQLLNPRLIQSPSQANHLVSIGFQKPGVGSSLLEPPALLHKMLPMKPEEAHFRAMDMRRLSSGSCSGVPIPSLIKVYPFGKVRWSRVQVLKSAQSLSNMWLHRGAMPFSCAECGWIPGVSRGITEKDAHHVPVTSA